MAGWCQQTFCFQKFVDNAQPCFVFTPQAIYKNFAEQDILLFDFSLVLDFLLCSLEILILKDLVQNVFWWQLNYYFFLHFRSSRSLNVHLLHLIGYLWINGCLLQQQHAAKRIYKYFLIRRINCRNYS